MARTENLRKQHAEILNIAREIDGHLSGSLTQASAAAIRPLLSKLAGVVSLHVAIENMGLYPGLIAHADATVRETARRHVDEMASLAAAFGDYIKNYETAAAMCADPARFALDSKAMFSALGTRIHRENTELFAVVDKLAG